MLHTDIPHESLGVPLIMPHLGDAMADPRAGVKSLLLDGQRVSK